MPASIIGRISLPSDVPEIDHLFQGQQQQNDIAGLL